MPVDHKVDVSKVLSSHRLRDHSFEAIHSCTRVYRNVYLERTWLMARTPDLYTYHLSLFCFSRVAESGTTRWVLG